nr:MAG TPA: hypothetical protein [Caudoviricetes sp.]
MGLTSAATYYRNRCWNYIMLYFNDGNMTSWR